MSGIKKITDEVKSAVAKSVEPMKQLTTQAKSMANKSSTSISKVKQQVSEYKKNLNDTKLTIKELRDEAGKLETKGIDPYSVLSTKDSFRLLGAQMMETIPIIADIGKALKDNLDGKYGDSLLMKFKELGAVDSIKFIGNELTNTIPIVKDFKKALQENLEGKYGDSLLMKIRDIGIQAKESANKIKTNLGTAFDNVKSKVQDKIYPILSLVKNFGSVAKNTFQRVSLNIKESANTTGTPLNKIKTLINHIKNIGKESDKTKKKTNTFGNTLGKTFSNGISSIKKFALGLLSVRTAFSVVSKAMQSYLSYDTQLSDSIQNCWNVLGSLLAPILEVVVSLFSKAVSYVNAFVQALTGINLVARANSKAIDSQAKSTKKLSDTQSSLDEFHTVNTDSGSGSDNKAITVEPVDMDKMDFLFDWIDKAKKFLITIFDPLKQAWENKGKGVIDSLKNAFNGVKNLGISVFSSILDVWTNGTGQKIIENYLERITICFNIVGELAQALSNAWNNAGNGTAIIQAIADIFISLQDIINSIADSLLNWVMSDNFQTALNLVVQVLSDLFGYAQEIASWVATMYETYLAPVVDKILDCVSKIIIAIGSVWEFLKPVIDTIIDTIMNILEPVIDGLCGIIGGIIDTLSGVADFITGVFTGDWNKAWEGIKAFLGGIIDAIASLFSGLFNTIGAIFKGAWDIIVSIWSVVSTWFNDKVIKPLANLFSGIWNTLKNGAQNAWNGIKNIFSSVATFFKNIFSNAWNGVKNVFSSGGKIFGGIKDGIFNAFKSVVNTLIAGINKVVSIPFNAINTALKTVRDISFLGIEPFKGLIKLINVPQIPSLATGAVLDSETIVRVAEYSNAKSNPEIVSPKDMMKETMKEALEESNHNNSKQQVDVNITGKLTAEGDDLVYVYDKNKKDKGYDGGKNPSFAY